MTNLMIRIHDVQSNVVIDREMNTEELKQHNKDAAYAAKLEQDVATAAADKAALLTKLGITAEEAALLLS